MLAVAPPWTTAPSINPRRATPILPIAIGRSGRRTFDRFPKRAFDPHQQQNAKAEIPIAFDARPLHTSRGFLPWRFAYAGPRVRRATVMGPASENLHKGGHSFIERYATSISAISWLLSASPSERLSDLSFHRSQ